jgi:hypothetical protein
MKHLLPLIVILLAFTQDNKENKLIGTWIYSSIDENTKVLIYKRVNDFSLDSGGYCFKSDGSFVVRENAGWCGTPPITYSNYKGKWHFVKGDSLQLNYSYWGGDMETQLYLIEVDSMVLKFAIINSKEIKKTK